MHHIIPESDHGQNTLENAIVLCSRCHGEVGHYNVRHPVGNKYSTEELCRLRDEWWNWCEKNPATPLPKHPISVSPGTINLGTRGWKVRSLFKVHNKSNEIYYDIWIKLTIDAPEIFPHDIIIDTKNVKNQLTAEAGSVRVCWDIVRIDGTDSDNKKVIFLLLKSLEPGEVLTFMLRNNSRRATSTLTQPKVLIGVSVFSTEPNKTVEKPGQIALIFAPPENMTIKSLGFMIKRSD